MDQYMRINIVELATHLTSLKKAYDYATEEAMKKGNDNQKHYYVGCVQGLNHLDEILRTYMEIEKKADEYVSRIKPSDQYWRNNDGNSSLDHGDV